MKRFLKNQNGSAMLMALLFVVFFTVIAAGAIPFTNSQVKHTAINVNIVSAQYAAEAGAKRAIIGIENGRKDWKWALDSKTTPIPVADGSAATYSITSISPAIANGNAPVAGTTYTITARGTVSGVSKNTVATVKPNSGIFTNAIFSHGTLSSNGNVNINGTVASDTKVDLGWSTGSVTTATSTSLSNIIDPRPIAANYSTMTAQGTIDIASLTPTMPILSLTGVDLPVTTNATYSLGAANYKSSSAYEMNGLKLNFSADTVTIYIKGSLDIKAGSLITGKNIIIYATGDITFNGGSISAGAGGTVALYTLGSLKLNDGASYINGSTVTLLAKQDATVNNGTINATLSGAVTKIYCKNFYYKANTSSIISGAGVGEVIASSNIEITQGYAPTTLFIAGNDLTVKASTSTVVGGLYSNGTINTTGIKVTYSSTTAATLGLATSSGAYTITWSSP